MSDHVALYGRILSEIHRKRWTVYDKTDMSKPGRDGQPRGLDWLVLHGRVYTQLKGDREYVLLPTVDGVVDLQKIRKALEKSGTAEMNLGGERRRIRGFQLRHLRVEVIADPHLEDPVGYSEFLYALESLGDSGN